MKKKVLALLFSLFLLIGIMPAVLAEEIPEERQLPLLVDYADLLSEDEESKLLDELERMSETLSCEIAVVTVDSLDGKTAQEYADDFYDYNGYGYGDEDDGVLLLISMEARDWAITTYGSAWRALSDYDLSVIEDNMLPYLSNGAYYDAFMSFASDCEKRISDDAEESWYDDPGYIDDPGYVSPEYIGNSSHSDVDISGNLFLALIIGVVLSLITVTAMKGQLKSVQHRSEATDYVRRGSLSLRNSSDIFLYRTVNKRPKPTDNNHSSSGRSGGFHGGGGGGHRSSSGRSHGGRSGKF